MRKEWGDEETELLKKVYSITTNEELKEAFPERTQLSIYKKARKLGLRRSRETEYQNRSQCRKGEKCCNWKGGKKVSAKGYVFVLQPEHHRADSNGYVMEHIVVFEKHTGIKVPENCVVHHLNGNKKDNRIENLCLMEFGAHSSYHNRKRRYENA